MPLISPHSSLLTAQWNLALDALPASGIRQMLNVAATLPDVIHLSIGQPDFPTPPHILQAYTSALAEGKTRYTMDAGLPELLTELARHYSASYGPALSEDNILVTCGASEALFLA